MNSCWIRGQAVLSAKFQRFERPRAVRSIEDHLTERCGLRKCPDLYCFILRLQLGSTLQRFPRPDHHLVAQLRHRLAAHLGARGHAAASGGQPVATGPAPVETEVRRNVLPGFHHRSEPDCDLLH